MIASNEQSECCVVYVSRVIWNYAIKILEVLSRGANQTRCVISVRLTSESVHVTISDTAVEDRIRDFEGGGRLMDESQVLKPEPAKSGRKSISFACAVLNCLSAGSLSIFSLYPLEFQGKLAYTQVQVNAVSIAGELGMYLIVPFFGWFCDRRGPRPVSLIAGVLFALGYVIASLAYATHQAYYIMMLGFVFVGAATSAMYLSAVTTCAKNHLDRPGLALSIPITAFGVSSLWQAQVAVKFFSEDDGSLNCGNLFFFFALLLGLVGLIGAFGLKVVPTDLSDEVQPLIRDDHSVNRLDALERMRRRVLKDRSMRLFAIALFLVAGPAEMFLNNMGSLIHVYPEKTDPAPHVSMVAFTSTVARISSGLLADWFATRGFSRMWLLIAFTALMAFTHFYIASGVWTTDIQSRFYVASSTLGLGYGAVFTLMPTLVPIVWGAQQFGTVWGALSPVVALGAVIYGTLYAFLYDAAAGQDGLCFGWRCYRVSFLVNGLSVTMGLIVWIILWQVWRLRKIRV